MTVWRYVTNLVAGATSVWLPAASIFALIASSPRPSENALAGIWVLPMSAVTLGAYVGFRPGARPPDMWLAIAGATGAWGVLGLIASRAEDSAVSAAFVMLVGAPFSAVGAIAGAVVQAVREARRRR